MEKYQLAVLEDDALIREETCRICGKILFEAGIPYEITPFSQAEALENAIMTEQNRFHLLILDIEMEGMSGMELAKRLRMEKNRVSILFLTGHDRFWREGFGVQPIQYLLKPADPGALKKALLDNWELNCSPKTVVFQKGNRTLQLPVASILYAASGGNHSVEIYQEKGMEVFGITLLEMERLLGDARFVRCHASYLVNLEHVREFSKSYFRLDEGTQVPIGRKYCQDCQQAMLTYVNR